MQYRNDFLSWHLDHMFYCIMTKQSRMKSSDDLKTEGHNQIFSLTVNRIRGHDCRFFTAILKIYSDFLKSSTAMTVKTIFDIYSPWQYIFQDNSRKVGKPSNIAISRLVFNWTFSTKIKQTNVSLLKLNSNFVLKHIRWNRSNWSEVYLMKQFYLLRSI